MVCMRTLPSEVVYCIAESGREEAAIVPLWHTQWWTPVSEAAGALTEGLYKSQSPTLSAPRPCLRVAGDAGGRHTHTLSSQLACK